MKRLITLYVLMPLSIAAHTHLIFHNGHVRSIDKKQHHTHNPFYSDHVHVYFSPDDNIRHHLIQAIEHEKLSIKIAVFTLTDKLIANALLHAHHKGVVVEIITDPVCIKDRFNKITMLSQQGIPVYIYSTENGSGLHSSMHHKFALFGRNLNNQHFVWTGSFNFTKSASDSNQENVVVIHQQKTTERFEEQFSKIKSRSQRLVHEQKFLLRNKEK